MNQAAAVPDRVRVLILGGGIHGVGTLHDMVSRGWSDVFLVEKETLGSGTSSSSTKLIHGGLRYLQRISEFSLVTESLQERRLLCDLAPDIVHPLQLYFPILKQGGTQAWMVRFGLGLYDALSGKNSFGHPERVDTATLQANAALLNPQVFSKIFSFWDAQTDDLALVQRVAQSGERLGGKIFENCRATAIKAVNDGFELTLKFKDGSQKQCSALYVVNALGPWANRFLESSGIEPECDGFNNKGVHLLFPDRGLKVGVFLQSSADKRNFFLVPWKGYTLFGTTEENYSGDPDNLCVRQDEAEYLLASCNAYIQQPFNTSDILAKFAGLRWLAKEKGRNISATSRESVLAETASGRGLLLTIYGGKLTSYRTLAERIGSRICSHFGEYSPSKTAEKSMWLSPSEAGSHLVPNAIERFADFSR